MSDDTKKTVKETKTVKRAPKGAKVNSEKKGVDRGTRVPLGGFTGPLAMIEENKDPEMHYSWVLDDDEDGSKIERRLQAGYEFCDPKENLVAGSTSVYSSVTRGSLCRKPAGQGRYLYLMKIPQEWYEDDKAVGQKRVDATENSLHEQSKKDGFFGELKIG